jgi:hypothetical protein
MSETGGKSTTAKGTFPTELSWIRENPPPDLQELVVRYGSYVDIPREAWEEWDRKMRAWQQVRRDRWLR